MLDNLIAFRILYLLVQPFKESKAYKLGIIDEKGTVLRKSKDLKTQDEKNAFTLLHRLVFNLKKILAKLPGGETKLASIAAAYFLVKENYNTEVDEQILQEQFDHILSKNVTLVEETITVLDFIQLFEDAPVNATGPAVSTNEPVIKPRKKKNRFASIDVQRAILP